LYYYRARYYNPAMKRFISEDPIQSGINFYAYVGNNPVNYIDSLGLFKIWPGKCVECDSQSLDDCIGIFLSDACEKCRNFSDFYDCRQCEGEQMAITLVFLNIVRLWVVSHGNHHQNHRNHHENRQHRDHQGHVNFTEKWLPALTPLRAGLYF